MKGRAYSGGLYEAKRITEIMEPARKVLLWNCLNKAYELNCSVIKL